MMNGNEPRNVRDVGKTDNVTWQTLSRLPREQLIALALAQHDKINTLSIELERLRSAQAPSTAEDATKDRRDTAIFDKLTQIVQDTAGSGKPSEALPAAAAAASTAATSAKGVAARRPGKTFPKRISTTLSAAPPAAASRPPPARSRINAAATSANNRRTSLTKPPEKPVLPNSPINKAAFEFGRQQQQEEEQAAAASEQPTSAAGTVALLADSAVGSSDTDSVEVSRSGADTTATSSVAGSGVDSDCSLAPGTRRGSGGSSTSGSSNDTLESSMPPAAMAQPPPQAQPSSPPRINSRGSSAASLLSMPESPSRPKARIGTYSNPGSSSSIGSQAAVPQQHAHAVTAGSRSSSLDDLASQNGTRRASRRLLPQLPEKPMREWLKHRRSPAPLSPVAFQASYSPEQHQAARVIQLCYRQYRMKRQFSEARGNVLKRTERRQSLGGIGRQLPMDKRRMSLDRLQRFSRSLETTRCDIPLLCVSEEADEMAPQPDEDTSFSELQQLCMDPEALPAQQTLVDLLAIEEDDSPGVLDELQQSMVRLRQLTNAASTYSRYLNLSSVSGMPEQALGLAPPAAEPTDSEDAASTEASSAAVSPHYLASVSFKQDVIAAEKQRLTRIGVYHFNTDPDHGISYLIDHRIIGSSARSVANFMFTNTTLNRGKIGEYLGGTTVKHLEVLDEYVKLFAFHGLEFDSALRQFLASFRLPGEAQKIERILEIFAMHYQRNNTSVFLHSDTPFILAFSLVMLNTDSHNKANKNKMTKDQFVRNNSGIDDGNDLPRVFLEQAYDRIVNEAFCPLPDNTTLVEEILNTFTPASRAELSSFAEPWRQFIGVCNVTEIEDLERPVNKGKHCRTFFLFNDCLLIAKLKGNRHVLRQIVSLHGLKLRRVSGSVYRDAFYLIEESENRVIYLYNMEDAPATNSKFDSSLRMAILDCEIIESDRADVLSIDSGSSIEPSSSNGGGSNSNFMLRHHKSLDDLDRIFDADQRVQSSPMLVRKKSTIMRAMIPNMFNKLKRNLAATPKKRPVSSFSGL